LLLGPLFLVLKIFGALSLRTTFFPRVFFFFFSYIFSFLGPFLYCFLGFLEAAYSGLLSLFFFFLNSFFSPHVFLFLFFRSLLGLFFFWARACIISSAFWSSLTMAPMSYLRLWVPQLFWRNCSEGFSSELLLFSLFIPELFPWPFFSAFGLSLSSDLPSFSGGFTFLWPFPYG